MLRFERDQKVYDIRGVKVGGQPGEYPTVLIGSIFYEGHKIVKDKNKGIFDKVAAEELVKKQEELSDKTGNPHMLDVVISSTDAISKYLSFVAEVTDAPFLLDAWPSKVRIQALGYVDEVGLSDRVVNNSLWFASGEDEIEALKRSSVKSSVILAYNPKDLWARGPISMLKGTSEKKGLLEKAEEAGVEKKIIDTSVLHMPHVGTSSKAIYDVKREFGLPAGCGPANATTTWKGLKEFGPEAFKACDASTQTLPIAFSSDFLLYGPIESAGWIFPACAAIDAMIATGAREIGTKTQTQKHPLYKLFPKFADALDKGEILRSLEK